MLNFRSAWGAQTAKHLTLGRGSGHDLAVREFQPRIGLHADSAAAAWDSLSLAAPPPPVLALSKEINRHFIFF